jgi:ABC-type Fe3+ transport system substrate-binding protein
MLGLLLSAATRLSLHLFVAVLAGLIATGGAAQAAPDKAALLKGAQAEGVVIVHGPPGRQYEKLLSKGFEESHPGIRVEYSGANNRTAVPKLFREREANLFLWDVWMGGPATILQQLMPRNVLAPLPPILLAENTDDSKWVHGFADGWMDKANQYNYAFDGGLQETAWVNWDFVSKDEIKSVQDVLKPKFAGKILWDEPRRGGSGNGSSLGLLVNYGEDFLRKLYAHNVTVTDNRRQAAEWLVRGRYPIVFGTGLDEFTIFKEQGLAKNLTPIPIPPGEKVQMTPGFGSVSLVDRAPHPNAAALYINWLLSQDGQTKWTQVPRISRRLDSPCTDLCQDSRATLEKAGPNYFKGQDEEAVPKRERAMVVAKEVIKAEMPKSED